MERMHQHYAISYRHCYKLYYPKGLQIRWEHACICSQGIELSQSSQRLKVLWASVKADRPRLCLEAGRHDTQRPYRGGVPECLMLLHVRLGSIGWPRRCRPTTWLDLKAKVVQ